MTYEAMANDIQKFIHDRQLKEVTLLGHSMGGKVAMAYALSLTNLNSSADILSQLIIADIAPSIGSLSREFIQYISLMQEIENLPPGTIKTRSDADKRLQEYEPDMSVRQFLLTNLQLPSHSHTNHGSHPHKAKFVVPLDVLSKSIPALGSFPYQYSSEDDTVSTTWQGPTLAIKGSKSNYINHRNLPAMRAFFPSVRLEELDAGHWVHAERPTEFRKLVVDFMNS